jgi:ComF family protein
MALINDFLSLIYPRLCEACGNSLFRHERFICNLCRVSLPRSNYHIHRENELSRTFAGRIQFQTACSFFLYEKKGRVQKLLHAIKYHSQTSLAEYLGKLYGENLGSDGCLGDVDVIVPVPLHRNKLRSRGFNQSECFAKGLSSSLVKPVDTLSLERTVDTKTQTRKKKYQRWENVEGIFNLTPSHSLSNKHVLLVDDVITTGATIEAAWLALSRADGLRLSVASIAFAAQKLSQG